MDFPKLFGALSACLDKVHHPRSFRAFVLALVVATLFGVAVCGLRAPQSLPWLMCMACLIVAFACFVLWHDRPSQRP
jgi:hypothetical protein